MIVSISLRESRQGSGVCVHMPFVLTISNEENLQIRLFWILPILFTLVVTFVLVYKFVFLLQKALFF